MTEKHVIPGYYTIQEAAPKLRRSEATVTRYCQAGKLSAIFTGVQWLIEQASLEKFKEPRRGNPNWTKGYKRKKKNPKK